MKTPHEELEAMQHRYQLDEDTSFRLWVIEQIMLILEALDRIEKYM